MAPSWITPIHDGGTGQPVGTGFFISSRYIVTCRHCTRNSTYLTIPCSSELLSIEKILKADETFGDIAVLPLNTPVDIDQPPLFLEEMHTGDFRTLTEINAPGYPAGVFNKDEFKSILKLSTDDNELLKEVDFAVGSDPGMSGAPVIACENGIHYIIGMMRLGSKNKDHKAVSSTLIASNLIVQFLRSKEIQFSSITFSEFEKCQVVSELKHHLETVIAACSKTPLCDKLEIEFDKIRIPLKAVPYESDFHKSKKEKEQAEEQDEPFGEATERKRYQNRGGLKNGDNNHKPKPLGELIAAANMVMVLGDPGSGKSEFLKKQAVAAAKELLPRVETLSSYDTSKVIPVFLRFDRIAELLGDLRWVDTLVKHLPENSYRTSDKAQLFCLAIIEAMQHEGRSFAPTFVRFLWNAFWVGTGPKPVFYFDALDEVRSEEDRVLISTYLPAFIKEEKARIITTSRIVGFDESKIFGDCTAQEKKNRILCIRPFEPAEVECFINSFFYNDTTTADALIEEVRTKPPVLGTMENPLLSTLICRLFSKRHNKGKQFELPLRNVDIYNAILKDFLSEWKIGNEKPGSLLCSGNSISSEDESLAIDALSLLAQCTFPMEILTDTEIDRILREFNKANGTEFNKKQFSSAGILVPAGIKEYMFLHLTFQEYLAGRQLAGIVNYSAHEWSTQISVNFEVEKTKQATALEILDHKAWDPIWEKVIVAWVAQLDDPQPALELLAREDKDDFFRHRLELAALCIMELAADQIELSFAYETIEEFCKIWYAMMRIGINRSNLFSKSSRIGIYFILYILETPNRSVLIKTNYYKLSNYSECSTEKIVKSFIEINSNLQKKEIIVALTKVGYHAVYSVKSLCLKILCQASKDVDCDIKIIAINSLKKFKIEKTLIVEALIFAIDALNDEVKERAIIALGSFGAAADSAVPKICFFLKKGSFKLKITSSFILSLIATTTDSLEPICDCLKWEDDSSIKVGLISALGSIGTPALSHLIKALNDEDYQIRLATLEAITKIGPGAILAANPLFNFIKDTKQIEELLAAVNAFKVIAPDEYNIQKSWIDYLIENQFYYLSASLDCGPEIISDMVATRLGHIGAEAATVVPSLIRALQSNFDFLRVTAAEALGEIGTQAAGALGPLVKALEDNCDEVRPAAAKAIGKVNTSLPTTLIEQIINTVQNGTINAKEAAIIALGELGSKAIPVVNLIAKSLLDENICVKLAAIEALGKIGPAAFSAVDLLDNCLHDEDYDIKIKACEALGKIGPAAAASTNILISIVQDNSMEKKNDELLKQLLHSIVTETKNIFPGLYENHLFSPDFFSDESFDLRWEAAETRVNQSLFYGKNPQLQILVENRKKGTKLRQHAIETLGNIGPQAFSAIQILLDMINKDEPFGTAASNAIKRIGIKKIVDFKIDFKANVLDVNNNNFFPINFFNENLKYSRLFPDTLSQHASIIPISELSTLVPHVSAK